MNEKISLSSEQVEILQWNFQERHDLILKSHKKTRFHPLSRVYKFGASYNYCKNLKWKNLSKIFDFSILGTGQSFCLSFCLNIKLQQLSKFEVRERFARYPSFLQKLHKFFYFSSKIISWPLSFCRFCNLSYNCCQNLKWKNTFRDFQVFDFGYGAKSKTGKPRKFSIFLLEAQLDL